MKKPEEIIKELGAETELSAIDFRVQSISEKGYCTVLGYKDARFDMSALDRIVGPFNWGCEYKEHKGNLFCGVWIRCPETKDKVYKWNAGTESNTEAVKGEASDAFKRACFLWGIGRDLYDLPKISFMLAPNEFNVQQSGQKKIGRPTFDFVLAKWQWSYNDKGTLFAKDNHNRIRYNSSKDYNALPK